MNFTRSQSPKGGMNAAVASFLSPRFAARYYNSFGQPAAQLVRPSTIEPSLLYLTALTIALGLLGAAVSVRTGQEE
jgi:hypothetical protein